MLGKTVFVSILLSAAIAVIDSVDVLQKHTPAQMESCCPQVVSAPQGGSIIEPNIGYKVNVALIVDYGNCTANSTSFECCAVWGDGKEDCTKSDKLMGCQLVHEYPKDNKTYTVTGTYCNEIQENDFCCSSLTKSVIVSQ